MFNKLEVEFEDEVGVHTPVIVLADNPPLHARKQGESYLDQLLQEYHIININLKSSAG